MGEIGKRAAMSYFAPAGAQAGACGRLVRFLRVFGLRRPAQAAAAERRQPRRAGTTAAGDALPTKAAQVPLLARGLSTKLLVLTILFVMIAEVLIFLPSIANFRLRWLEDG